MSGATWDHLPNDSVILAGFPPDLQREGLEETCLARIARSLLLVQAHTQVVAS